MYVLLENEIVIVIKIDASFSLSRRQIVFRIFLPFFSIIFDYTQCEALKYPIIIACKTKCLSGNISLGQAQETLVVLQLTGLESSPMENLGT